MRFVTTSQIAGGLRYAAAAIFSTLLAVFGLAGSACAQAQSAVSDPSPGAAEPVTNTADLVRVSQAWTSQNQIWLWIAYLAVVAAVGLALNQFRKTEAWANTRERLQNEVLTNWRLSLLAVTSLALTLASGWTTWDGMTNFTGTPVLSFLITLGIQGVMLIAAWLIGESFAVGLASSGNGGRMSSPDRVLAVLSVVLMAAILYAVAMATLHRGTIEFVDEVLRRHKSELALPIPKENFRILLSLGFSALLTALMVSQKEIFEPYLRGLKAILKSLPIWLMFLACMFTSVFFSFDSLFSTIFPARERERAAQLRTTNQVAGIVADLGVTISKHQGDSVDALFSSPEWKDYAARINDIVGVARAAPEQIAELARKELEAQQSVRAGLEERKASAEAQRVRLDKRKEELLGNVNKLKEEVPPIAAEVDRLKSDVFKKESEILGKKAEMQAEAGGVGGTLKVGQGPEWQKRRKELDDFATLKGIVESQLKDRTAQLKAKRDQTASAEAELAQIDGEIGKLTGEKEVADKQMASVTAAKPEGSIAAARDSITAKGYGSLDEAFAQFRQRPDRQSFDAIQQQCAALLTVFDKVPALKATAAEKNLRCDPTIVAESVTRILALNDGLLAYKDRCSKPDSLPQSSVDDLLKFGQQCVQTSGLDGKDTALFRSGINSIGLNRDDKAHRFVVSWNAFLDGNRLAYLALAIAFALDGLVFMSGLFGANAVSSPLARLPLAARRSAADLEATMYASLRPDIYGSAKLVIDALHPIKEHDGFVSEVRLSDYDRVTGANIRRVLSAGAQFGAVEPDPQVDGIFLVRGELSEFLAKACERELRSNNSVRQSAEKARETEALRHAEFERKRQAEAETRREADAAVHKDEQELQRRARSLEPVLTAALIPEDLENKEHLFHASQRVLAQMRPTAGHDQFTSEIDLTNLRTSDQQFFRGILNTAAARRAVEKAGSNDREVYLVRPELTLCLTAIRVKAYEDWQRRTRKQGMFGWLLGQRDATFLRAREAVRPSLQIVAQANKGPARPFAPTPALGGPISRATPLPGAPEQLQADPPQTRRELGASIVVAGRLRNADVDPQKIEQIVAWSKYNAYSELDVSWLRLLLKGDRRGAMNGYLGEILSPAVVEASEAEARAEIPRYRKWVSPDLVTESEADALQRALSSFHQLQNLRELLESTLDKHEGERLQSPEQEHSFVALRELSDAVRIFPKDSEEAFDVWRRAVSMLRRADDEAGRQRAAL